MNKTATDSPSRKCAQCGAKLPANVPAELCPKCLLKAAFGTQPIMGPTGTVALPALPAKSRGLPQPGEQLGHYRIVRTLGQGGMGAVFEADDLDSGRRVALKALSHTLDSPEARERFFREGRLAASINHPNSVYVFGTEEIGGTPVIAMELVSGGTLQDRVNAHGPLPIGEAVDCVLQIIAGLEAAQRIGILHRDVKPSNCFRDTDGTVKIGDFGLSISTNLRTEPALTMTGAFLGTPAFCSPEQLRGEELNALSDMYSVGATLFYVLTGRAPFEAKNVVQLLATVLEHRPPSPRKLRANIPRGLAGVILRCLAKQPGERFKSYQELARALAPYSSVAPTPATLGLRCVAGMLDMLVLSVVGLVVQLLVFGDLMAAMDFFFKQNPGAHSAMLAGLVLAVLYYALPEGIWGATAGKAVCRLRVVAPDNNPPGVWRGLLRALMYVVAPTVPSWIIVGGNPQLYLDGSGLVHILSGLSFYFLLALLFCTARRRNGFAALHDLMTRTRVISRTALLARPVLAVSETAPAAVEAQPRIGPYHVLEPLGKTADAEWLLGYDLRLLRKVWIRVVPPGTPPVPSPWRNIGRAGRLRWLTGVRSPEENWDAFEGVSGQPLANLVRARQPWAHVRFWLHDLASEISAAEKDGTLPAVLALDRVWITGDGRAKLLDFPAPGLASHTTSSADGVTPPQLANRTAPQFLDAVATAALAGRRCATAAGDVPVPLPLHARAFLQRLPQLPDASAITTALKPLLSRLTFISRWRRAAVVAGCVTLPVFATVTSLLGFAVLEKWNQSYPGLLDLSALLQQRSTMRFFGKNQRPPTDQQYAVFIATHYRSLITNEATWSAPMARATIKGDARRFAEQSVAEHPAPGEKEVAEADAAVKPYCGQVTPADFSKQPNFPLIVANVTLAIYVGLPALLAALLFRGGLVLRITNITFVRRDGVRASRLRVFWRALLAWSPVALAILLFALYHRTHPVMGAALGWALAGVMTIVSVALPQRGWPDYLAGTWPVPR